MTKKHDKESKKKTKKSTKVPGYVIYGAIFVVLVLVFSALMFSFSGIFDNNEKVDYSMYNRFSFTKLQTGWQTIVEKNGIPYEAPFYNHPLDIDGIVYQEEVTTLLNDVIITLTPRREFTIAIHPDSGAVPVLAGVNIAKITGKFYGAPTSSALFMNATEEKLRRNETDLPIVNCDDATFKNVIIHISATEEENAVKIIDNFCVGIYGTNESNVLMAADLVGYKLLGIMK